MYGYNEFIPLTAEEILLRVSQEDIFKMVLGKDITVDKDVRYLAPYRSDSNPDCYLEYYDSKLYFIDFADTVSKPKDCFMIVSKTYGISYLDSLEYINSYFKLGLGNSSDSIKEIIENVPKVEVDKEIKRRRTITYLPREFNHKDATFWGQYQISKQNLIDDGVIPLELFRAYTRKNEPYTVRPFDIMYAYTGFDNDRVKIYRPYGDKHSKWTTNCIQDDIGSIEHLPWTGDKLIISKSYKDCRVLRNQGLNSVWFQNEGMIPNSTILKTLCNRFESIYVWFDNDQAGLASGKFITDHIASITGKKVKFIFLPPKLLRDYNIKDPSDLIAQLGLEELISFIKSKNLL